MAMVVWAPKVHDPAELSRKGWAKMTDAEKSTICEKSVVETNFVSTIEFSVKPINTKSIAMNTPGAKYNPAFDAVMFKMVFPCVTVTIYGTGVAVFMGADSDYKVMLAAHKIVYIVAANSKPQQSKEGEKLVNWLALVNIHNVVASVLAFPVHVHILLRDWGHAIEKPEKFPGLTLTCAHLPIDPPTNIVIEIFPDSGKMNITGAKTRAEIPPVYRFVHEHILKPAEIKSGSKHPSTNKYARAKRRKMNDDSDSDDDDSDDDSDDESESDEEEDDYSEDEDEDGSEYSNGGKRRENAKAKSKSAGGGGHYMNEHQMFSHLMTAHGTDDDDDMALFAALREINMNNS